MSYLYICTADTHAKSRAVSESRIANKNHADYGDAAAAAELDYVIDFVVYFAPSARRSAQSEQTMSLVAWCCFLHVFIAILSAMEKSERCLMQMVQK